MKPRVCRKVARWLFSLGITIAVLLFGARDAAAYPWMIRDGYTSCITCHADPSGAGVLTPMGRRESDLTLRTRYGGPKPDSPAKSADFLFGAFEEPDGLFLGGSFRSGIFSIHPETGPSSTEALQMQADLKGQLEKGGFRAGLSFGFMAKGAQAAWVTRNPEGNLVSREHWVGWTWNRETPFLVRAGRINLPFGVRDNIHPLWVRQKTRTDINDSQQHGVALAYSGEKLRGEVMGIAGNYQISPDAYRERGFSGFAEYAIFNKLAVGASTLGAWTKRDPITRLEGGRMAHGLFLRASPVRPLVVLAEGDLLLVQPKDAKSRTGHASMLLLDLEVLQGVHVQTIGETSATGATGDSTALRGWLSALWFFAPHADARLDAIQERLPAGPGRHFSVRSYLFQLHLFL